MRGLVFDTVLPGIHYYGHTLLSSPLNRDSIRPPLVSEDLFTSRTTSQPTRLTVLQSYSRTVLLLYGSSLYSVKLDQARNQERAGGDGDMKREHVAIMAIMGTRVT